MYPRFGLLILYLAVAAVQGDVKLTKGRNETISFKGEEVIIDIDNTLGATDDLTLCFGSSPETSYDPCPHGFARLRIQVGGTQKLQLAINRQGRFVGDKSWLAILGNVKFNNDGTLNIMVLQLPDAKTTVTLPNAELFVPEKQVDVIVQKKKSNVSTVGIIAIIILLLVVGVIVGILVWCCVTSTLKSKQTREYSDQDASPPLQQKPFKRSLNTETTTVQTTVSPKQVAHPSSGTNKRSTLMHTVPPE